MGVRAQSLGVPIATPSPDFGRGIRVEGPFYTAGIFLDGASLFRIATLTNEPAALPIALRREFVLAAIEQVTATRASGGTVYDPASLRVELERGGTQMYLVAIDKRHPSRLPILTVTTADAQYANVPVKVLAQQWQQILQTSLVAALQKRQPQEIRHNFELLAQAAGALLVVTVIGIGVLLSVRRRIAELDRRLTERREQLDREQRDAEESSVPEGGRLRRRALAFALRAAGPDERLRQARALAAFVVWALLLLWMIGVAWGLLLFPQTSALGSIFMHRGLRIAFIWIAAGLVNRLGDIVIGRVTSLFRHRGTTSEDRARMALRAPTVSRAISGFKTFVVLFTATLATLGVLDVPIASVVTIGGIAALAIGFAAQSLVRDFLNGLLVLIEDHYAVGDYVMIDNYNGLVEHLTLRIVQVRDARGYLVTIPHSAVSQVVNASRNWSRVDFRIAVASSADIGKAVDIVRSAIDSLTSDPQWREQILETAEWIGVEALSKDGVVLRASVRTAPLRQFAVRREMNARVHRKLTDEGIELGIDRLAPAAPPVNASPDPT